MTWLLPPADIQTWLLSPADILECTDRELGMRLLAAFISHEAYVLGLPIDQIPVEFAKRVVLHIPTLEADTARDAAVEKALHKAASGDYEAAGRIFRGHMMSRAEQIKFIPLGMKFSRGRKKGAGGPIRKAVAKLLKANPSMKNPQLWEAIKAKPPKGWGALENRLGKYLEGPGNASMSYQRFCNVCSEERKKITG